MQQLMISGRLPGYNQLKGHWAKPARIKKDVMELVGWEIRRQHIRPVSGKSVIAIRCYEPDARRDDDNVTSGAAKVVLDALKNCGIIKGDGRKYVRCVKYPAEVDRKNPRVEVVIEADEDKR